MHPGSSAVALVAPRPLRSFVCIGIFFERQSLTIGSLCRRLGDAVSGPGIKDWRGMLGARAMMQGFRPAAAAIAGDMDERSGHWLARGS